MVAEEISTIAGVIEMISQYGRSEVSKKVAVGKAPRLFSFFGLDGRRHGTALNSNLEEK